MDTIRSALVTRGISFMVTTRKEELAERLLDAWPADESASVASALLLGIVPSEKPALADASATQEPALERRGAKTVVPTKPSLVINADVLPVEVGAEHAPLDTVDAAGVAQDETAPLEVADDLDGEPHAEWGMHASADAGRRPDWSTAPDVVGVGGAMVAIGHPMATGLATAPAPRQTRAPVNGSTHGQILHACNGATRVEVAAGARAPAVPYLPGRADDPSPHANTPLLPPGTDIAVAGPASKRARAT